MNPISRTQNAALSSGFQRSGFQRSSQCMRVPAPTVARRRTLLGAAYYQAVYWETTAIATGLLTNAPWATVTGVFPFDDKPGLRWRTTWNKPTVPGIRVA